MWVKQPPETRKPKHLVTSGPYKNGYRLRWKWKDARRELYIPRPTNEQTVNRIKTIIEQELLTGTYEDDLRRYKELLKQVALQELWKEQLLQHSLQSHETLQKTNAGRPSKVNMLDEFDRFLRLRNKTDDTNYYYLTRKLLVKWGAFDLDDVPTLLNAEKWSAQTFNARRTCLNTFFTWLCKKKVIVENPLSETPNKKRNRMHDDRQPFTDTEAAQILEAIKTDRFRKKSSRYSHKQYYPFVAFLMHIGCRPGEAIGLKVKYVDFENRAICIGHSLSRTLKGTHAATRVYKSTKNMKVRYIPMDTFLIKLLEPLCKERSGEDFVFINENGNTIDDRMFLRRVFKPVQDELKIRNRVVYALRHSFATRAVRQGMIPSQVAYLMGDTVETVLRNYFHNNMMPAQLPNGVPTIMQSVLPRAS